MGYKHHCKKRCKCHKPDIVLKASGQQDEPGGPILPLTQKTCKYELDVSALKILKKCRELKVKGSVTGGSVIISVQTGTETPRQFTFENETFELVENLKKGDAIVFLYFGAPIVELKASIRKRCKRHH